MGYYSEHLAGRRLERCYEVASPRVRQYLEAELAHVIAHLEPTDAVLEIGCGTGRITHRLADVAQRVVGIDTAKASVELAREQAEGIAGLEYHERDALDLGFAGGEFDVVVCAQDGLCAFGLDPGDLILEALRVTRPGGLALFSTYSDAFWPHRLAWFEAQAAAGLVGPLDHQACVDGRIVCLDGFSSGRMTRAQLTSICETLDLEGHVQEVDCSSLFLRVHGSRGER